MYDLKTRWGLWRSALIYVWKPFNRRRLRRFYRPFVPPGALCFDIGAHLGSRTRAFLDLGARVVAVEPQPRCAAYIEQRWGRDRRCKVISKGIGAQPGKATLHINSMNPTISTFAPNSWRKAMAAAARQRECWDQRIEVEMTTLDRMIEEFGVPHFCKIDVEGFESQALAGLSHPLPALSFEFISFEKDRMSACLRRLEDLGAYRFNWSLRERLRLESPVWVDAPQAWQALHGLGPKVISGDIYARLTA